MRKIDEHINRLFELHGFTNDELQDIYESMIKYTSCALMDTAIANEVFEASTEVYTELDNLAKQAERLNNES